MPLYDYNKKASGSFLKKLRHDNPDAILEEDRYTYKGIVEEIDDNAPVITEPEPEDEDHKVDYVRRVPAFRAYLSAFLAVPALGFLAAVLVKMYRSGTSMEFRYTVFSACSCLWAAAGLVYAVLSLKEEGRDYRLSAVMMAVHGSVVVFWIIVAIIGFR